MNPWYILKIDKTNDKNAVKAAYMTLLPNYNPEVDAEGFANLRCAYEEALKEIDQGADSTNNANDPVSKFFAALDELYKDFSKRIDPAHWEEALQSDVCTALDTEEEVDVKILEFLSRNHNLPTNVWVILNGRFRWTDRADRLRQRYGPGLINAIISCVNSKFDLHYELFDYDQGQGADVDRFIFTRNALSRALDDRKKDEADKLLEELQGIGVKHPIYDFEMARYLTLNNEAESALAMINAAMEKHPEFQSEPFAIQVKASVLLGFDDKIKHAEALRIFKKALEIVPNYYFAQLGIVDTLVKQEEYDEAEKYLADTLLPENPSHGYLLAYLKHVSGLKLKKYEALLEESPIQEIAEKLAECYAHANEHEKCIQLLIDKERTAKACYLLGGSYSKLKEYDKALNFIQESIEKESKYSSYTLISGVYITRRLYDKAVQNADIGLGAGLPEEGVQLLHKARLFSDKAYACMKLGRYNQALEVIDEAMAINDKMCDIYADKAEILMYMGKYRDAYAEAEKAMNLMPTWPRPYELMADIFYGARSYDQMEEIFKKAEEMQIKSHGLTYLKGCRAGAIKEYEECHEILKNLLDEDNLGTWEDKSLDALCHYMQNAKNYERVALYAETLIRFYAENDFSPASFAYIHLANAHKDLGNPDKRLDALLTGLKALPDNERLLTQLGYYYDATNSPERHSTWKRMQELYPNNAIPYNRIAMLLNKEEKYQEAIDIISQGLEQIPASVNLLGRRAYTYYDMKEYEKAVDDFIQAAENPKNQQTWWDKGVMYYEAADILWGDLNDEENGTKYYLLAEEHGGINTNRKKTDIAVIYERQKNYEKALALYDECINGGLEDNITIFSRGCIYKILGETTKAQEDFDKIIERAINPEKIFHDVYRFAGRVYLEMDMPEEARKQFEKATEVIKTDGTKNATCFCIHQSWALYYKHIGEYQKALEQIDIAIGLVNSVRNNAMKREIEQAAVL